MPAPDQRKAVRIDFGWLHHNVDSRTPVSEEEEAEVLASEARRDRVQRLIAALTDMAD